jgi:hypothetical protein
MDDGVVRNEVAARPSLRATGPVHLAGAGNRSVAFAADEAEQYLLMEGQWAPPRDSGYAVELWFSPERIGLAALAGLFSGKDQHVFLLELTSVNRRARRVELFQRVSVRFLDRWPPAYSGGDNLFSDYYVPYRWHHVVAQRNGDQMELFVNGEQRATLSSGPARATEACRFLVGRLKPSQAAAGAEQTRSFIGQIDELALYDHPLSAEEIRLHHALGATAIPPSAP